MNALAALPRRPAPSAASFSLRAVVLAAMARPAAIARPELEQSDERLAARLKEVAMAALKQNPGSWDGAKDALYAAVRGNPDLLWEMFQPFRAQAAQRLLSDVAATLREPEKARLGVTPPRQGGAGPAQGENRGDSARPTPPAPHAPRRSVAGMVAASATARRSLLDTFRVAGQAIGDLTPTQANRWAGERERDARFVRLLTANLPPDQPIRKFRSAEQADEIFQRAGQETGHE